MKTNEAPEKLYIALNELDEDGRTFVLEHRVDYPICTEYTRTDIFIEKARKWFKEQNEWFDPNGNYHCDIESFKDFVNYMKGE
jgi:hypothetical protein